MSDAQCYPPYLPWVADYPPTRGPSLSRCSLVVESRFQSAGIERGGCDAEVVLAKSAAHTDTGEPAGSLAPATAAGPADRMVERVATHDAEVALAQSAAHTDTGEPAGALAAVTAARPDIT